MSRDADKGRCPTCGAVVRADDKRILVSGRARRAYCSPSCLRTGAQLLVRARRRARLERWAILVACVAAVVGAGYVRQLLRNFGRHHAHPPTPATAPVAAEAPPEPTPFGPHWPPTDEEWREQFVHAAWVDPLPGPTRHPPAPSARLVAADARARCRTAGRCGAELGGELWGEHVYAAHDGVINRLQRSRDDVPGGLSVRIASWGGAVFTQYFHLAAVPSRLSVGMHVSAGDVIGLVGDTGLGDAHPHLGFTLSVRPASDLPEIYWDPEPLMATWPLRTPGRGSVAGLAALDAPPEHVAGTPVGRR